jgi:hypothetical protein
MPGFKIDGYGNSDNIPNTIEIARSHRWRIENLGPIQQPENKLVARDLTLPTWKPERLEILGTTLYYKYAKNIKWEDVTVIFYDNYKIGTEIDRWRDRVHTNIDGIKKHGAGNQGYKLECEFHEIDGRANIKRKLKLFGAWPTNINYGKLSYTDTSLKVIELTLAYDYAQIENA